MKVLLIIVTILLPFSSSIAQIDQNNNVPHLDGHYFVPNSGTPNPFIQSSFGMNLGIASTKDFENIILEIDEENVIGLKGSLIFATLDFDYQQKVKDWIAFYLNVGITARLGTELQSMLTQGVSTVSSFRLGWLVHLAEGKKDKLSADIQVNNHNTIFISISDLVDDINNNVPNPSISRTVPLLNGGIGLRYAHAFSEKFGFKGFGNIGYGESYERSKSAAVYNVGGLFDLNLATTTKVPLGFALFYNLNARADLVQVPNKFATNTGVNISYTTAQHFNVGLVISRLRVPIPGVEEKVNSASALFTCKYFFN